MQEMRRELAPDYHALIKIDPEGAEKSLLDDFGMTVQGFQFRFPEEDDADDDVPQGSDRYFVKSRFIPRIMLDALNVHFDFIALPTEKGLRFYQDGVYQLDTGSVIQRDIHGRLECRLNQRHVTETLALLRDRHMQPLSPDGIMPCQHPNHINVANGILDIHSGDFTAHTPQFKSLIQLPVTYDPNATCPNIDAFLDDVLQGNADDIQLAHQIIGYAMLQQVPLGKMFVLLGPTHTGKSTFLELITALLGSVNVSGISLQALDDENLRFTRSGIYGKLANIAADLSAKTLAGDSKVKEISVGDKLTVERKGIDGFLMRPFATLICAANEMPTSRDKSDAWLERLIILPFTKQHKGQDAKRNLIQTLTTDAELSGLFNHAFKAVTELLKAGVFVETESTTGAAEDYRLQNDNIARFLEDNFEKRVSDIDVLESDLYEAYVKWCEKEGVRATSNVKARKAIAKWLGVENPTMATIDGKRKRVWRDVVFRNDIQLIDPNDPIANIPL